MAVKLHRCSAQWVRIGAHPCWRVEKELVAQGVDYERVPGPAMPWERKKRTRLFELTGGYLYPAIEFEDGSVYREQSSDMAARIRDGRLFEARGGEESPASS